MQKNFEKAFQKIFVKIFDKGFQSSFKKSFPDFLSILSVIKIQKIFPNVILYKSLMECQRRNKLQLKELKIFEKEKSDGRGNYSLLENIKFVSPIFVQQKMWA